MAMHSFLSGEWYLADGYVPNGGSAVVVRSAWVTSWVMLTVLTVWNILKPCEVCTFQREILAKDLIALAPWTGAVFGGVYLAFYARFAAQWTYLANLYNQIKQAEVLGVQDANALAQWKAGFIEDALELHLASKSNIAGVIRAWSLSNEVRECFLKYTPNGEVRWSHVLNITNPKK